MVEMAASRSRWRAAEIFAASAALLSAAAAGFSFSFSAVFAAISQFSSMLGNLEQTVKHPGNSHRVVFLSDCFTFLASFAPSPTDHTKPVDFQTDAGGKSTGLVWSVGEG